MNTLSQYRLALTVILCLVGMFSSAFVHADELGRLFTTPAQRAELNYLRQTTKVPVREQGDEEPSSQGEPVAIEPPEEPIRMQGYVKRSDGQKGTVWLNQQPIQEGGTLGVVKVGRLSKQNKIELSMPGKNAPLTLKPGQTYDPSASQISDVSADLHR